MNLLAIDIGGTNVKLGIVSQKGNVHHTSSFSTQWSHLSTFTDRLFKHLKQYNFNSIDGIAISCTGLANQKNLSIGEGNTIFSVFGQSLPKQLSHHFSLPVSVENDGNCAILAEHWLGAAKGKSNVASIVIGTSIGGAIIINNQLYKGSHNLAGEFGYALIEEEENQWQIWSIIGSTQGLIEQFNQQYSGFEIFSLYRKGDFKVIQAVELFAERIAVQCYNLQYFLDPDLILIGGGISEEPLLMELIEQKLDSIIQKISSNVIKPTIKPCQFGNQANLIGAAKHWLNIFKNGVEKDD